ncbi:MAG: histidinol dehydrogenase [Proteobacteria bacterium]|nr:histidinol dehydrogenase [Pseudomonadota bacterium]
MQWLNAGSAGFDAALADLLSVSETNTESVRDAVRQIISAVRSEGDQALVRLTNQLDGQQVSEMGSLRVSRERMADACQKINPITLEALTASRDRVRAYHQQQLQAVGGASDWSYIDELGNSLGQSVRPMERVGIYAPGGKAAYPSTVIMTAIPARVAGVQEIVLCVPTPGGEINEVLLAAAHLCDIDHVFAIGGAQAVAAMAYGTRSVPPVDKIVGPGNIYVATAKEMVFGQVGIDMIAGPSEVVIVADDSARAEWLVLDLFAQAEHDEMAQSILISPSQALLAQVRDLLPARLAEQSRQDIIRESLDRRGALIQVEDLAQAFDVVNRIAPEHLQLVLASPRDHLGSIRHAGAIFLGENTTEVVGDYTAGPSHVLPTSGTARFSSPLGVYDFLVRSSIVECSRQGALELNRAAAILAEEEGLDAHAGSARYRAEG